MERILVKIEIGVPGSPQPLVEMADTVDPAEITLTNETDNGFIVRTLRYRVRKQQMPKGDT